MKNKKIDTIKSTGFKTPEHYFDNFEADLMNNIKVNSSLKDTKDAGYSIPEHYFDTVEDTIMSKVNSQNERKVISMFSNSKFYYVAGIAASVILVLSIFFNNNKSENISADMVENYLVESDLNSYELAQLLSDANLLEEDFTIVETNYEEDQLETYLINNTDIELMLE